MKTGFSNIDDELNWYAFVMSEGNFEAAKEFVAERNRQRELDAKKENNRAKERDV